MAYDPDPRASRQRDKTYPSEIASDRPLLTTRIQCTESYPETDPRKVLRGVPQPETPEAVPSFGPPEPEREDMCARFNRQLRGE